METQEKNKENHIDNADAGIVDENSQSTIASNGDGLNVTEKSEAELNAALQLEMDDQKKKYLYLYAEFETYKSRIFKERTELIKFGSENIIRELLNVADNLDRALGFAKADKPEDSDRVKNLLMGLDMVRADFKNTLTKFGVQTIETQGKKFDPEKHEAVSQEKNEEAEEGTITKEHQPGYTLHGRLLRPARVVVAVKN